MRNSILLIALLLLMSCKAQENNNKTTDISIKNTIMERPIITPDFEKLNLDDFKEGLTIVTETEKPYKGNKFNSYSYRKVNEYGTKTLHGSSINGFGYSFTATNSYHRIAKGYYSNTFIKSKCIISSIKNSIKIGKQYFFDSDGKLEKTIDHDIGWDFSYEKIIQYILDRKASLFGGNSLLPAKISKQGTDRKYWELELDTTPITKTQSWEIVKLDAMTGEVLYQVEYRGDRIYHVDLGDQNPVPIQKIIVADKTLEKK